MEQLRATIPRKSVHNVVVHTMAGEKLATVSGSRSGCNVEYSDLYLSFHSQLTS